MRHLSPARAPNLSATAAPYCISNHINAAASAARGVETIHSISNDGKLATAIYRAIVDAGMPGRRVFTRKLDSGKDYYFMHRDTGSVATVIVEYGFATDPEDTQRLIANWQAYAEAVVRAFCQHVDHPYVPPAPPVPAAPAAPEQAPVSVIVNGQRIDDGVIIDDRAYVPLRAVGDAIGAAVSWDAASRTAMLKVR